MTRPAPLIRLPEQAGDEPMASYRKRGNYWYIRYLDADGIRREVKAGTGRREAEMMAAQIEAEARQIRAGLIDPKAVRYREHAQRPLADHLDDWRRDMEARGRTANHAGLYVGRVGRLAAVVRGTRPADLEGKTVAERDRIARKLADVLAVAGYADLTPERIQSALARLGDANKSLQTLNHYRAAVRAFSRWSIETGRIRDNPMRGVKGYNAAADRRHERRCLAPEELGRLVAAAESGPERFGMTGPLRAMAYRLAAATGLRVNELRALTRESFDLAGDEPTVSLPASAAKNGKAAEQPIPLAMVPLLRPWLARQAPRVPVLPLDHQTAKAIKADLADAGIAYRTDDGIADFHSLRAFYVSALVRAGADIKEVQHLARHAAPQTTLNHYAKVRAHDLRRAVESLPIPSITADDSRPHSQAATGTTGPDVSKHFAHLLPHSGQGTGAKLTESDGSSLVAMAGPNPPKPLELQVPEASGRLVRQYTRQDSNLQPTVPKTVAGRDVNPMRGKGFKVASKDALPTPCPTSSPVLPPDLALVVESWDRLPEAVRAGIVAMVRAASGSEGGR